MVRKTTATLILLIVACFEIVKAQPATSAVPFLLIAPNSRASGLGESGVAIADDAWAQYWNPAGYGFQTGSEISLSHANWLPAFQLPDLWIAHGIYKHYIPSLNGTVALGLAFLNLGEFNQTLPTGPEVVGVFKSYEFAITGSYGGRLTRQFGIGLNARFIHSRLSPFGTAQEQGRGIASGFSFDIGMLYKPRTFLFSGDLDQKLAFGLNISNIGPNLTYIDKAQADPLPMNFRIGMAYQFVKSTYNNITFNLDFNKLLIRRDSVQTDPFYKAIYTSWYDKPIKTELRELVTGAGIEYWYGEPKLIALRAGYFYEDPEFGNRKFLTFGAGIRYDVYGFDFSYISTFEERHPLAETLRFTLMIGWGSYTPTRR